MKTLTLLLLFVSTVVFSQVSDSTKLLNTYDKLMNKDDKFILGGYAQIDYNHRMSDSLRYNGKLDVHRLVTLMGYKFNEKTHFFSEIEFEHVDEVYVEQVFINHEFNPYFQFRAGLLLIPFGIINEYHEPPTFYTVNRPYVDKVIAPTTWREIGAGFIGNLDFANLKYQMYLVNGLLGYNNKALFNASNGVRSGRQKGARTMAFNPNFAGKVEYYGVSNLNLGLSGYFGKTETNLNNNLDLSDENAMKRADSSIIGMSMVGFDAIYKLKFLEFKSQFYYSGLSNTEAYNKFSNSNIGNAMMGYYVELAYNHYFCENYRISPFVRYENLDTQYSVTSETTKSDNYNKTYLNAGLNFFFNNSVVLKADMELYKSKSDKEYTKTLNFGLGIMF